MADAWVNGKFQALKNSKSVTLVIGKERKVLGWKDMVKLGHWLDTKADEIRMQELYDDDETAAG